jgi:hypothetical protein
MKGLIFTLLILTSYKLFGQYKDCSFYIDSNGRSVYTNSTIEAKPKIRENNILVYLNKNLKLDDLENIDPTYSKTIVKIIITDEGEIIDNKIIKVGINGVGEQMIELLTKIKWEPATCGNKKVSSELIIPLYIDFK